MDRRARRIALIRLAAFGTALAALAVVATFSGLRPSADEVRDWGDGFGAAGPVVFIVLSVALACLLVPGPLLAGAAGLLFGTALGTPVALIAAVLTAVAEMTIGRYVSGPRVGELLPERVRRFDAALERRGFTAVLYMRLAPGIPYHLVNYGAGVTRLRVRDMAAGTLIGALPRTFAYVALGGNLNDLGSPEAIAAIVLLVVTGLVGLFLNRREVARGARSLVTSARRVSYFKFVRIYSALEAVLFTSLLVVWIGGLSDDAKLILGWTHGFGWIFLCLLVYVGCVRKIFPWPLLAATVSPLGPIGSVIGFEWIRRTRRRSQLT